MERRWLIGVGWVGTIAIGGTILLAMGLTAPGDQSPPALRPAAGAAPGGPGGAGNPGERSAAGPSASPPGARGGSIPPRPDALRATVPGTLAPAPLDQEMISGPPPTPGAQSPGQAAGPGAGAPPPPPARVAAVSYLLDILESVSKVTPGIANGAVSTVLGTALQSLPAPVQETVATGSAKLAEQLSVDVPRTIGDVRSAVAHLSVANPEVNQALSLAAAALSGMATPSISPLDQIALQLAKALEALAEPVPSPSPSR